MATVKKQTDAATGNNVTKTTGNSLFTKDNYMWMVAGLVVMALGFFLMSGGKSADPNVFNKNEVYSTTRITIAPILIIAGLLIEIFAIMKKTKES
jgi:heme/copper-type cytochrome/quinol oxidase subunit 2